MYVFLIFETCLFFPSSRLFIAGLKTSCLGKQRYPKRRAEEETESDTIKISKKSRGPPTVGFLHRETYDDQQVCSSPFIFGQEIQSYPVPTPSIETSSKGIGEMIDSVNENFTNYCATFKQIRSELAQNFQDAQIKLKVNQYIIICSYII